MTIINMTPHKITNTLTGEVFPPSGKVIRISTKEYPSLVEGFFKPDFGNPEVCDLVEGKMVPSGDSLPAPKKGVLIIVSAIVREGIPTRQDLISPGSLVRDDAGNPIGCKGFFVSKNFEMHLCNEIDPVRVAYGDLRGSSYRELGDYLLVDFGKEHGSLHYHVEKKEVFYAIDFIKKSDLIFL